MKMLKGNSPVCLASLLRLKGYHCEEIREEKAGVFGAEVELKCSHQKLGIFVGSYSSLP